MDDNFDDWSIYAVVRGRRTPPPPQLQPPPPPPPANPDLSYSDPYNVPDYQTNPIPFEDLPEAYFLDSMPPPGAAYAFHPSQEIMPTINPPPPHIGSSQNMLGTNPQHGRQERRKNQHTKIVCELTQEDLSSDSWSWRKYGQKSIKGCMYPRSNYYRCNTSKGCAARRQVERSSNDPGLFVVSYIGDHTHPQPTQKHQSSLPHAKPSNKLLSSSSSVSFPQATGNDNDEEDDIFMIDNMEEGDDHCMMRRYHDSDHDHSSGGGGFYAAQGDGQRIRG